MLFTGEWRWFNNALYALEGRLTPISAPSIHCHEKDGVLTWRVDLPGVNKEDLTIEVIEGNYLAVTGKREDRNTIQEYLPVAGGYKAEEAEAVLKNGVLTLTFKANASEKKLIEVK